MNSFDSDFVIPFEISKARFNLSIKDRLILLGSCFADNIGRKLSENKFKVLINPTGIIYNPISLFKLIRDSVAGELDEDLVIERQGIFYHLDAHSSVWAKSKKELLVHLLDHYAVSRSGLSTASALIFSFGTSLIYHHAKTNSIVANCHKIPQKEFSKKQLTVEEIVEDYFHTIDQLRSLNPDIKVIFTVSPVRHIRDGLIQNNLSKSILIQAIQKILEKDSLAAYFPSYEIVIDVLRDYRFYKEDMIHPNDQAIEYIWKKFRKAYFDQKTLTFIDDWAKIRKSMNHKPFHPNSETHQKFLKDLRNKLLAMQDIIEVESELKTIDQKIKLS